MKQQSLDTSIEVEKKHIELIRKASISKKFSLIRSLTRTMLSNGWRGVKNANPNLSEQQQKVFLIRMLYGDNLAKRFEEYHISKR